MIIIYLSNRYIRVLSGDAAGERISVHKVYHAVDCLLYTSELEHILNQEDENQE